jgi:bla regulator protein blaR1
MKFLLVLVFLGLVSFVLCTSLWPVDDDASSPATDSCRSATPKPGCLTVATPARLIPLIRPEYPMRGKKKKHGTVNLRATITASGDLKGIQAIKGDDELKQAALSAVRQWRYRPATINGVPIEVQHKITIDFTTDDGVLLGADDLPPQVPTEPSGDLLAKFRTGKLPLIGGLSKPVSRPKPIYTPDPEYSEIARKYRQEGTCLVGVVVGADGRPDSIWIIRPLGYGLDQKAVETLRTWRFQPATREGAAVPVMIVVEVSFHLT